MLPDKLLRGRPFWLYLAPLIPYPFEIDNVTINSLVLSWPAAEGASYYRVAVEDNEGLVIRNVTSSDTELLVSELQPGTTYRLSVTVYDGDEQRGNTLQTVVSTGNCL